MTQRLSDVWIQYATDDMKNAKVLLHNTGYSIWCAFIANRLLRKRLKYCCLFSNSLFREHTI